MSIYKNMKTDEKLTAEGVTFELYGNRIKMARAGIGNPAFQASMTKRTQPYRRQIANNTMDGNKEAEILRNVYADSVIHDWEVQVDGEWKRGIEAEDGSVIPFTKENVVATLEKLPELFLELQQLASNASHYRVEQLEDDSGN